MASLVYQDAGSRAFVDFGAMGMKRCLRVYGNPLCVESRFLHGKEGCEMDPPIKRKGNQPVRLRKCIDYTTLFF